MISNINAQASLFEPGESGSYFSASYTNYEDATGLGISLAGITSGGTSFGLILANIQQGQMSYFLYGAQLSYRPLKQKGNSPFGSEIGFSFVRNGEFSINSFGVNAMLYTDIDSDKNLVQPFIGATLAYNIQKRAYDTKKEFSKSMNGGIIISINQKAKTSVILTPFIGYGFDTKESYIGFELGFTTSE